MNASPKNNAIIMKIFPNYNFPAKLALQVADAAFKVNPDVQF